MAARALVRCPPDGSFVRMMSHSVKAAHPAGHYIFKQGDDVKYFFCLLNGEVEVVRTSADGKEEVLNTLRAYARDHTRATQVPWSHYLRYPSPMVHRMEQVRANTLARTACSRAQRHAPSPFDA